MRGGVHSMQADVIFLATFQHPKRKIKVVEDLVVFRLQRSTDGTQPLLIPDTRHQVIDAPDLWQVCPLNLKANEQAILSKLDILHVQTDFQTELEFRVEPFSDNNNNTDDGNEEEAEITYTIPPHSHDGSIHPERTAIYQAPFHQFNFNVPAYAGLEHAILNKRSSCVNTDGLNEGYEAFMPHDPFMVFLLEHGYLFANMKSNDICKRYISEDGEYMFLVRSSLCNQASEFFEDAIFPQFTYTTRDAVRMAWKYDNMSNNLVHGAVCNDPIVVLRFRLEYYVINPMVPKIGHKIATTSLNEKRK